MKCAAFLDRDGVINADRGYLYRIEDFVYLNGAVDGLHKLQEMGFLLVIVTNQSGIARGYYTETDYRKLETWLLNDLEQQGIFISGSYHCPHHPEGIVQIYRQNCECRKPKTALFYQAAKELEIDLSRSIAIGDNMRDLSICREAGVKGFLLAAETLIHSPGISLCKDWAELIDMVENQESAGRGYERIH